MRYPKWLAVGIAIGVAVPMTMVIVFTFWHPITISDLPADEHGVINALSKLNINVSAADYFSIDFRIRGRVIVSCDTDDGHCHIIGFELLPSCAAPVGARQLQNLASETTQSKLVSELIKCRYLQRVIIPDASKATMARLRRELPDCFVSSSLSDAQSESAKVINDAIGRQH